MKRNWENQKQKKQSEDKIVKEINVRIIRDIKNLFEQDTEDCYKPVRVGNFYGKSYIEYESNVDRNKTLSIKKYLDESRPYFKNINNLKNLIHEKFN